MARVTLFSAIIVLFIVAPAYTFCFEEAGAMYGVSPRLLWAIAKVESGFNPSAVNYNQNGTYDFGVMQINSMWRRSLGKNIWQALGDPCINVKVGAWILAQCIQKHGYTWKAVGCYNASSEYKGMLYIKRVYGELKKIR